MIDLDCSVGEGGGGMLRCALPLAAITMQSVRLRNFRARRSPESAGVGWIHKRFIEALCEFCGGASDADWGATSFTFWPGVDRRDEICIDLDDPRRTFASDGFSVVRDYAGASDHFADNIDNVDQRGVRGHSIGGFMIGLAPLVVAFPGLRVEVVGGTETLGAPFIDAVTDSVLPSISTLFGTRLMMEVAQRGTMGRGGGYVCLRSAVGNEAQEPIRLLESTAPVALKAKMYLYGFERWRVNCRDQLIETVANISRSLNRQIDAEVVNCPSGANRWALLILMKSGSYVRDISFTSDEVSILHGEFTHFVFERISIELALATLPSRFLVEQLLPVAALYPFDFAAATERVTPHLVSVGYVISTLIGRAVHLRDGFPALVALSRKR